MEEDNESVVTTEETSNIEDLCCVCRDPYTCALDYGPYITLGCGCGLHHECLVHYIRTKLEDKSSILIFESRSSSSYVKGIICPNHITGWCKKSPEKYLLPWKDFEDVRSQATELNIADSLSEQEMEKIQEWLFTEESSVEITNPETASDPLIEATTKPCPECGYRASHPHGHGCHHISPYGGCPSCHSHFCYKCLSSGKENTRMRAGATNCKCGYWSSFCSTLSGKDIAQYLVYDPYPRDVRCGCVICSCCKPNRPCAQCPGSCAVCRGHLPPAPSSMDEIEAFKIRVKTYSTGIAIQVSLFDRLLAECRAGSWIRFQRIVSEMPAGSEFPINRHDYHGRTLLHYACHNSSASAMHIIRYLVEAGADVVRQDNGRLQGRSALEYALTAYASAEWHAKRSGRPNEYALDILMTMFERRFQQVPANAALSLMVNDIPFPTWIANQPNFYQVFIHNFPTKSAELLASAIQASGWEFAQLILQDVSNLNTSIENFIPELKATSVPILVLISHIAAHRFSLPITNMKATMMNQIIREWHHHVVEHRVNRTILHELIYFVFTAHNPAWYVWKNDSINQDVLRVIIPLVSIMVDAICQGTIITTDGSRVTAEDAGEAEIRKSNQYNVVDDQGNTILHMLAYPYFQRAFVQWFERFPETILVANHLGDTPLHWLLMHGKFEFIFNYFNTERAKHLLAIHQIVLPFQAINGMGETPLHVYARNRTRTLQLPTHALLPKPTDNLSLFLPPPPPPSPTCMHGSIDSPDDAVEIAVSKPSESGIEDLSSLFEYFRFLFSDAEDKVSNKQQETAQALNLSAQDRYGYTIFHILVQEHDQLFFQSLLKFAAMYSLPVPYLAMDKLGNTLFYYIFYQVELVSIVQLNHMLKHSWKLPATATKLVFNGLGAGSMSVGNAVTQPDDEDRLRSNPEYSPDSFKTSLCDLIMKYKPSNVRLESLWMNPNIQQKRTLLEELCYHPSSALCIFLIHLLLPYEQEQILQQHRSSLLSVAEETEGNNTDLLLPQNAALGNKTALMLLIESCEKCKPPSDYSLTLPHDSKFPADKMWCLMTVTNCLLSQKALYQQDEDGNTILHSAIFYRRKALVLMIIENHIGFIQSNGNVTMGTEEIDEDDEEEEEDEDDENAATTDEKQEDKTKKERKSQLHRNILLVQNDNGDTCLHVLCDYESVYDFHEEENHVESAHASCRNLIRQVNNKPLILPASPPITMNGSPTRNCHGDSRADSNKTIDTWKQVIYDELEAWDSFAYAVMYRLFTGSSSLLVSQSITASAEVYTIFSLPNRGPKCSILRYALLYHLSRTSSFCLWILGTSYPWKTTIRQGIPMALWIMIHPDYFCLFRQLYENEKIIVFTKEEILDKVLPSCLRMLTRNWSADSHPLNDQLLIYPDPEMRSDVSTGIPFLVWLTQRSFSGSSHKCTALMKGLYLVLVKEQLFDWQAAHPVTGYTVIHTMFAYLNPGGFHSLPTASTSSHEQDNKHHAQLPASPVIPKSSYARAVQDTLDVLTIFFTYHQYDIYRPVDHAGNSPLHIVCQKGHADLLRYMIHTMNTPPTTTTTEQHQETVEQAEQHTTILWGLFQQTNAEGNTPLQCCFDEQSTIYLLASLDCFTTTFTLPQLQTIFHHPNHAGDTLFHQWSTKKWFKAWNYVVERYGVSLFEEILNRPNHDGMTVLYILCGDFRFFPLLQACLPQFHHQAQFTLFTTQTAFLETPFQRICGKGVSFELLEIIFTHCRQYEDLSNMLCQSNGDGNTPILLALKAGETNVHTFQALLHPHILNHVNALGESIVLLLARANRVVMWKAFCAFPASIEAIVFDVRDPENQDNLFHLLARKNYSDFLITTLQIFHETMILDSVGTRLLLQPDARGDTVFHILVQQEHMTCWKEMVHVLHKTGTLRTIGKALINAPNAHGDNFIRQMAQTSKVNALESSIQQLGLLTDGHITEIVDCESVHHKTHDTVVQCILKTLDNKTIRKCLRMAGIKL